MNVAIALMLFFFCTAIMAASLRARRGSGEQKVFAFLGAALASWCTYADAWLLWIGR